MTSPDKPASSPIDNSAKSSTNDADIDLHLDPGGIFRGIAAATRKLLLPMQNAMGGGTAVKSVIRTIGQNRPLAFASEGAVAGQAILPRIVYYGAWTLSGVAIAADIYTKYDDAPLERQWNTVYYWTAFHVPASLVVPALIIHRVVHSAENAVAHGAWAKSWSPRAKAFAPVAAAILSIGPVVPVVDTVAEMIMEPTLGAYLGVQFDHHHHHGHDSTKEEELETTKPKQE